jgi:hypothetical protein
LTTSVTSYQEGYGLSVVWRKEVTVTPQMTAAVTRPRRSAFACGPQDVVLDGLVHGEARQGLDLLDDLSEGVDQGRPSREEEDAEEADNLEPPAFGDQASVLFVDENVLRMKLFGECYGLCLTWVELSCRSDDLRSSADRMHLQKLWKLSVKPAQFPLDCFWDDDPVEEPREQLAAASLKQRRDGGCIAETTISGA